MEEWRKPRMLPVSMLAGAVLLTLLALPLVALLLHTSPTLAFSYLGQPGVLAALNLSLTTTLVSTVLVVTLGTPLAYALARHRFLGKPAIEAMVHMPMVLPPAVAGLALLLVFGRRGWLGEALQAAGIDVAFTTLAVIIAQGFVSAPFYVRAAQAAFRQVDTGLEGISLTLAVGRAETFWRITLPLALPGIINGAAMAWARALGEFGATIMFAGNFPGRTQTMPLAVYSALQTDVEAAVVLSVMLLALSLIALAVLHVFGSKREGI